MKTNILTALLVGLSSFSYGQTAIHNNAWVMYFGNHRLTDNLGIHTEYQFRRNEGFKNWQQSLLRIGADMYLKDGAMLTAGYGWIVSFPYGEQPISLKFNEHRIWQQFIMQQQQGRVYFHHRYRLEQRFLENRKLDASDKSVVTDHRFRQRARYRIMASIPLNHSTLQDKTLFLALYEEAFVQFGKGVKANTLDQNRLYAALGWRFNRNFNIQAGYLNQRVFKADVLHKENNHTVQVGVTYNVDLRE